MNSGDNFAENAQVFFHDDGVFFADVLGGDGAVDHGFHGAEVLRELKYYKLLYNLPLYSF